MRLRFRVETASIRFSPVPSPPTLALMTSFYVGICADAGLSNPRTEDLCSTDGVLGREVGVTKTMKRNGGESVISATSVRDRLADILTLIIWVNSIGRGFSRSPCTDRRGLKEDWTHN
jgi:hypothetical protein